MKIGIVLNTAEPEEAWNAFRFGLEAFKSGHSAKVFLLGKGVEVEAISDLPESLFPVKSTEKEFVKAGGKVLACGTCLKKRGLKQPGVCILSSMKDLMQVVEESDEVLVFG